MFDALPRKGKGGITCFDARLVVFPEYHGLGVWTRLSEREQEAFNSKLELGSELRLAWLSLLKTESLVVKFAKEISFESPYLVRRL